MTCSTKLEIETYIKAIMVVAIVGMQKGAKNNCDKLLSVATSMKKT
jgi:hypothetical protein